MPFCDLTRSWDTNRNWISPWNVREISSSVYSTTRQGQLYKQKDERNVVDSIKNFWPFSGNWIDRKVWSTGLLFVRGSCLRGFVSRSTVAKLHEFDQSRLTNSRVVNCKFKNTMIASRSFDFLIGRANVVKGCFHIKEKIALLRNHPTTNARLTSIFLICIPIFPPSEKEKEMLFRASCNF